MVVMERRKVASGAQWTLAGRRGCLSSGKRSEFVGRVVIINKSEREAMRCDRARREKRTAPAPSPRSRRDPPVRDSNSKFIRAKASQRSRNYPASVGSLVLVYAYAARVGVNARHRAAASGMCAGARSGFERNGTAGSGFRLWLWVCAHRAGPRRAVPYRVGETATWVCQACDLSPGPGAWLISVSGTAQ